MTFNMWVVGLEGWNKDRHINDMARSNPGCRPKLNQMLRWGVSNLLNRSCPPRSLPTGCSPATCA